MTGTCPERRRHPLADRSLVDWDLLILMQPLTLAGALVGGFVNKLAPELLITVLLVILLGTSHTLSLDDRDLSTVESESLEMRDSRVFYLFFNARVFYGHHHLRIRACDERARADMLLRKNSSAFVRVLHTAVTSDKTVRKGLKLYAKETAAFERAAKRGDVELAELSKKQVLEEAASEGASLLGDDTGEEGGGASESRPARLSVEEQAELAAILAEERLAFPGWKAGVLIGMFVLTVAINLAKGGGAFPSPLGITCGSYGYWVATLVMFASLCAVAQYVRVYLIERTSTKLRLGYAFVEGDFLWDAHTTLKYPGICFFAGMCAGLFGIGGGIVNGPLMLEIGVLPGVAGATTAVMILLTAAVAGTTFLTFGLVQMDYAKYLFVVGLLATAVGQIGMTRLIKQTGRNSYIAFSIGAVVSLSTLLMGLHGLLSLAYPAEGHAGDGQNHGICASGD